MIDLHAPHGATPGLHHPRADVPSPTPLVPGARVTLASPHFAEEAVFATVGLIAFYVQQYNEVSPHSALNWRTPDEVYFGRAVDVPSQLEKARRTAREARMAANRATTCDTCRSSPSSTKALSKTA
jgi:hypothetical protein